MVCSLSSWISTGTFPEALSRDVQLCVCGGGGGGGGGKSLIAPLIKDNCTKPKVACRVLIH